MVEMEERKKGGRGEDKKKSRSMKRAGRERERSEPEGRYM